MFPRVTHPSAADVLLRPLDLHVLSLPPAFALSQDQTLKLDLETSNRLITTFDEVPPYLLSAIHIAINDGVTFKTCTAEVFRPASTPENRSSQSSSLGKSPSSTFLFLHLHLSNSPGPKTHRDDLIRRQITTDDDRLLIHSSQ